MVVKVCPTCGQDLPPEDYGPSTPSALKFEPLYVNDVPLHERTFFLHSHHQLSPPVADRPVPSVTVGELRGVLACRPEQFDCEVGERVVTRIGEASRSWCVIEKEWDAETGQNTFTMEPAR